MLYPDVIPGRFIRRLNRFEALTVPENGTAEIVHVKNTGRCLELLVPDCRVYLARAANLNRKTRFDLIAVEKVRPAGSLLINMDSQAVNEVAAEFLASGKLFPPEIGIKREVVHGDSRFDFQLELNGKRIFLEAKGVTLEEDGVAMFPDAPTLRGVKHLRGLAAALQEGFECHVLFLVQMSGMKFFRPAQHIHPEFADALRDAQAAGVHIHAVECRVTPDTLNAADIIPAVL